MKFEIINLILHKKILDLLMNFEFYKEDLKYLNYLIKERFKNLVQNNIIITPKCLLQIHYSFYIKLCGSLRYWWCFPLENHHSKQKKDVELKSRNIAITSFKNNFMFYEYIYNKIIFKKILNSNKKFREFLSIELDGKILKNGIIIEINNQIAKILKIYQIMLSKKIVLKVELLNFEKDDLGIYIVIIRNTNNFKFIYLKQITSIFNILKKGNQEFLVTKTQLNLNQ